MIRRPPSSTRTDTRFPYPTLFRSLFGAVSSPAETLRRPEDSPARISRAQHLASVSLGGQRDVFYRPAPGQRRSPMSTGDHALPVLDPPPTIPGTRVMAPATPDSQARGTAEDRSPTQDKPRKCREIEKAK